MKDFKKKSFKLTFVIFLLFSLLPFFSYQEARAVEINHAFTEQTTEQSHTGDENWTDVPGAIITDASLTDGDKYLLILSGRARHNNNARDGLIRTIHGSTEFEGSVFSFEPQNASRYFKYFFYVVHTAVASEDIKLQFRVEQASRIINLDQITMVAINLSDLTENTDWHFAEDLTDHTLDNVFGDSDDASITFTPNGTDDWLVLVTAQIQPDSASIQYETRITATGGVSDTGVIWSQEGEDTTNNRFVETLAKMYTPTNTSTTFQSESRADATASPTRFYNSVFALNLEKFAQHAEFINSDEISLATPANFTASTEIGTIGLDPDITGDVLVLGFAVWDSGGFLRARMQIENADQPPTQTSDDNTFGNWDGTDELPIALPTIENLATGTTHDTDLDASSSNASKMEDRFILMLTMELASTGNTRSVTDTPTITDSSLSTSIKLATDTPSITDSSSSTSTKTVTDTPSITDSFQIAISVTDTPTITDSATRTGMFDRTATDVISITDSFQVDIRVTDVISITDSATRAGSFVRTATDVISITDSTSTGNTRSVTDTPTITDSSSSTSTKLATDTPTITDSTSTGNTRSVTDTPTITDSFVLTISVTDTPTITDSTSTGNTRSVTDTPTITDSFQIAISVTDTPTITDSATTGAMFSRSATDTPTITDSFQIAISVTDTPSITDNSSSTSTKLATDTPTITDSVVTGSMFTRSVTDTPTITDNSSSTSTKLATDTPTITDSAIIDTMFTRNETDTPSITDSVSLVKQSVISVTDTPSITDSVDSDAFVPSGKFIWFNCNPAQNNTVGCIYAFECPAGQFVRGFDENATAVCAAP